LLLSDDPFAEQLGLGFDVGLEELDDAIELLGLGGIGAQLGQRLLELAGTLRVELLLQPLLLLGDQRVLELLCVMPCCSRVREE
jgi:hypothetical protein